MTHREAVEAAIVSSRVGETPAQAPLVELCRTLAAQMDSAGADPSTRLAAAYLSALKDLRRAIEAVPAESPRMKLAQLRAASGRPS